MGDSPTSVKKGGSRKSLIRDARGAVAIYVAIVVPVLFGVGALTLDVGRLITLHTELQAAADAASIAGARELDRLPGARAKAREAAAQAVANIQTFSTDGGGKVVVVNTQDCGVLGVNPPLGAACIRFLATLPKDDIDSSVVPPVVLAYGDDLPIDGTLYDENDPENSGNVATGDEDARFIDVHIGARNITNILVKLLAAFGQDPLVTSTTSATAVAGQDQVICEIPAMWMCNPSESPTNPDLNLAMNITLLEGRQMRMFLQAGGGDYTPGNWGLLCPNGTDNDGNNCGGSETAEGLASTKGNCVSRASMTVKPGVTLSAIRAGINVRLDYYTNQAKSDGEKWRTKPKYMPAANVTQGGKPKGNPAGNKTACTYNDITPQGQPPTEAMELPKDTCFNPAPGNCGSVPGNIDGNDRIGNGVWNYSEYFRINHPCNPTPNPDPLGPVNQCNINGDWKPADWDAVTGNTGANPTWPPTRYETYRYELETNSIVNNSPVQDIYADDQTGTKVGKTAEDGGPQCYTGNPAPEIPGYDYFPGQERDKALLGDRRVFPIAVVNCIARKEKGLKVSGRFKFGPPPMAFVFITEPIPPPNEGKIPLFVEVLGEMDDATLDDRVRDVVQIYRRRGQ